MLIKKHIPIFVLILLWCSPCFANEVYLVDINGKHSIENKYLEVASKYYGIEVIPCDSKDKCLENITGSFNRNTIDAIIITANSLSNIRYSEFNKITNKNEKNIPILIFGISANHKAEVAQWSSGSINNIKSISNVQDNSYFNFSENNIITRQLAGLSLSNKNSVINYFDMESKDNYESLIRLNYKEDKFSLPVFVKKKKSAYEVFFLTKIVSDNLIDNSVYKPEKDHFYEIAPYMMFLRYACKDRCWQSKNYYANLTVDDPWLREPYGHLSYVHLFNEMKKINFHTTIAFIPWNYDRSDNNVVSLIRNNLKNYSIAIHGNDHNHEEFYQLDNYNGTSNTKQLDQYDMKIKQAIARMEKFKELTRIPYDPVMIFPHRIAPRYAISLLKKNVYLATINARNVPLGSQESNDPTNRLRCITTDFEGFASYRRQEANFIRKEDIAIELFLDNPILLYTHHDYFAGNIGKFNPIARVINKLQPDVIWGSLGYIIRNYHLEKLRDDGNYDILMYTNYLTLTNNSNVALKYFIKKKELPSYSKIYHIYVDSKPISYHSNDEYITFEVMIPKQKSIEIIIKYDNEIALIKSDLSKNNYYYTTLRYISDFRDIVLSKNEYTRKYVDIYYIYYNSGQIKTNFILTTSLISFLIVGSILFMIKKYNSKKIRGNRK